MKEIIMNMQSKEWEMNRETNNASLSSTEENGVAPSVNQHGTGARMSLSLLRRRIRAGWYEDDLRPQEASHLLFLRWLVQAGLLSEWDEEAG